MRFSSVHVQLQTLRHTFSWSTQDGLQISLFVNCPRRAGFFQYETNLITMPLFGIPTTTTLLLLIIHPKQHVDYLTSHAQDLMPLEDG